MVLKGTQRIYFFRNNDTYRVLFYLKILYEYFTFRFYYKVSEKYISYPPKPTFVCNFLTKSLRGMGVIFLHRFRGWKDFAKNFAQISVKKWIY